MDEYFTTKELSTRIKIAQQTLYNMKSQGTFVKGIHYLQPSRKKTLWIWGAMKEWLGKNESKESVESQKKSKECMAGNRNITDNCISGNNYDNEESRKVQPLPIQMKNMINI